MRPVSENDIRHLHRLRADLAKFLRVLELSGEVKPWSRTALRDRW